MLNQRGRFGQPRIPQVSRACPTRDPNLQTGDRLASVVTDATPDQPVLCAECEHDHSQLFAAAANSNRGGALAECPCGKQVVLEGGYWGFVAVNLMNRDGHQVQRIEPNGRVVLVGEG